MQSKKACWNRIFILRYDMGSGYKEKIHSNLAWGKEHTKR